MTSEKRGTNHVTLLDVARESGFSASTVSIVLNDAPLARYVAATTKERIREAAHALGYYPDAFARSLRRRHSNTIGLMAFDLSDPFCTEIVRGAQKQLNDTRFLPLLMDAQNQRKQFEAYLKLLLERRVEGLIVVANWIFADFQFLSDIEKNNVPIVVVDRDLTASNIHSVLVDNEAGGYMAIEHLHRLGHTRIAVIRGPGELTDSEDRWAGIQRYASKAGLRLDSRLICQLPDVLNPSSSFEGGMRLTAELLRKSKKADFTALVAFDDLTALGAMRALFHAGRRVPEDCSVIGFDDILPAAVSSPGITTIRQPMETMGQIAASWIMEAIEADGRKDVSATESPMLRLLEPVLVVRESSSGYKSFQ